MNKDMILKRLKILSDLQKELNSIKENYEQMLENDKGYQEILEQVKKVKDETKEKQQKIVDNNLYKSVNMQLKEKRQEIKENREALSQELIDYYRENGTLEIEDEDGNKKTIKFSVRLV